MPTDGTRPNVLDNYGVESSDGQSTSSEISNSDISILPSTTGRRPIAPVIGRRKDSSLANPDGHPHHAKMPRNDSNGKKRLEPGEYDKESRSRTATVSESESIGNKEDGLRAEGVDQEISNIEKVDDPLVADDDSDEIDRPQSPDICAICRSAPVNPSFTDSCFHKFCFACLLEWSKIKAECPLCKLKFKSIIHNVRAMDDYDEYKIKVPPARPSLLPEVYIEDPDASIALVATLARDLSRHASRHLLGNMLPERQALLDQIGAFNRLLSRAQSTLAPELRAVYNRRVERYQALFDRSNNYTADEIRSTSEFRRLVYDRPLQIQRTVGVNEVERIRDTSPEFYAANEAAKHRLARWLHRELGVLLSGQDGSVQELYTTILYAISLHDILSPEFRRLIQPYLRRHADRFVAEFHSFARSPHDLPLYDRVVRYDGLSRQSSDRIRRMQDLFGSFYDSELFAHSGSLRDDQPSTSRRPTSRASPTSVDDIVLLSPPSASRTIGNTLLPIASAFSRYDPTAAPFQPRLARSRAYHDDLDSQSQAWRRPADETASTGLLSNLPPPAHAWTTEDLANELRHGRNRLQAAGSSSVLRNLYPSDNWSPRGQVEDLSRQQRQLSSVAIAVNTSAATNTNTVAPIVTIPIDLINDQQSGQNNLEDPRLRPGSHFATGPSVTSRDLMVPRFLTRQNSETRNRHRRWSTDANSSASASVSDFSVGNGESVIEDGPVLAARPNSSLRRLSPPFHLENYLPNESIQVLEQEPSGSISNPDSPVSLFSTVSMIPLPGTGRSSPRSDIWPMALPASTSGGRPLDNVVTELDVRSTNQQQPSTSSTDAMEDAIEIEVVAELPPIPLRDHDVIDISSPDSSPYPIEDSDACHNNDINALDTQPLSINRRREIDNDLNYIWPHTFESELNGRTRPPSTTTTTTLESFIPLIPSRPRTTLYRWFQSASTAPNRGSKDSPTGPQLIPTNNPDIAIEYEHIVSRGDQSGNADAGEAANTSSTEGAGTSGVQDGAEFVARMIDRLRAETELLREENRRQSATQPEHSPYRTRISGFNTRRYEAQLNSDVGSSSAIPGPSEVSKRLRSRRKTKTTDEARDNLSDRLRSLRRRSHRRNAKHSRNAKNIPLDISLSSLDGQASAGRHNQEIEEDFLPSDLEDSRNSSPASSSEDDIRSVGSMRSRNAGKRRKRSSSSAAHNNSRKSKSKRRRRSSKSSSRSVVRKSVESIHDKSSHKKRGVGKGPVIRKKVSKAHVTVANTKSVDNVTINCSVDDSIEMRIRSAIATTAAATDKPVTKRKTSKIKSVVNVANSHKDAVSPPRRERLRSSRRKLRSYVSPSTSKNESYEIITVENSHDSAINSNPALNPSTLSGTPADIAVSNALNEDRITRFKELVRRAKLLSERMEKLREKSKTKFVPSSIESASATCVSGASHCNTDGPSSGAERPGDSVCNGEVEILSSLADEQRRSYKPKKPLRQNRKHPANPAPTGVDLSAEVSENMEFSHTNNNNNAVASTSAKMDNSSTSPQDLTDVTYDNSEALDTFGPMNDADGDGLVGICDNSSNLVAKKMEGSSRGSNDHESLDRRGSVGFIPDLELDVSPSNSGGDGSDDRGLSSGLPSTSSSSIGRSGSDEGHLFDFGSGESSNDNHDGLEESVLDFRGDCSDNQVSSDTTTSGSGSTAQSTTVSMELSPEIVNLSLKDTLSLLDDDDDDDEDEDCSLSEIAERLRRKTIKRNRSLRHVEEHDISKDILKKNSAKPYRHEFVRHENKIEQSSRHQNAHLRLKKLNPHPPAEVDLTTENSGADNDSKAKVSKRGNKRKRRNCDRDEVHLNEDGEVSDQSSTLAIVFDAANPPLQPGVTSRLFPAGTAETGGIDDALQSYTYADQDGLVAVEDCRLETDCQSDGDTVEHQIDCKNLPSNSEHGIESIEPRNRVQIEKKKAVITETSGLEKFGLTNDDYSRIESQDLLVEVMVESDTENGRLLKNISGRDKGSANEAAAGTSNNRNSRFLLHLRPTEDSQDDSIPCNTVDGGLDGGDNNTCVIAQVNDNDDDEDFEKNINDSAENSSDDEVRHSSDDNVQVEHSHDDDVINGDTVEHSDNDEFEHSGNEDVEISNENNVEHCDVDEFEHSIGDEVEVGFGEAAEHSKDDNLLHCNFYDGDHSSNDDIEHIDDDNVEYCGDEEVEHSSDDDDRNTNVINVQQSDHDEFNRAEVEHGSDDDDDDDVEHSNADRCNDNDVDRVVDVDIESANDSNEEYCDNEDVEYISDDDQIEHSNNGDLEQSNYNDNIPIILEVDDGENRASGGLNVESNSDCSDSEIHENNSIDQPNDSDDDSSIKSHDLQNDDDASDDDANGSGDGFMEI